MKNAFQYAYIVLYQAVSPSNNWLNDCNRQSILGRIIRVTDEVIEYRKWIKETFESKLLKQNLIILPSSPPSQNFQNRTHTGGTTIHQGHQITNIGNFATSRRGSISSSDVSEESTDSDENEMEKPPREQISPSSLVLNVNQNTNNVNYNNNSTTNNTNTNKKYLPQKQPQQSSTKSNNYQQHNNMKQSLNLQPPMPQRPAILLIDSNDISSFPPLTQPLPQSAQKVDTNLQYFNSKSNDRKMLRDP